MSLRLTQICVIFFSLIFVILQFVLNEEFRTKKRKSTEMTRLIWKTYDYKQDKNRRAEEISVQLATAKSRPNDVTSPISQELSFVQKSRVSTVHSETAIAENVVKSRMKASRDNIIELCNNTNYSRKPGHMNYQLYAFKRLHWCSIPKCGSTFLTRELQPTLEITGRDSNKNPTTFVLVREPYSRIVSGFFSKIVGHPFWWPSFGARIVTKFRTSPFPKSAECGHDVTFNEFIQYFIYSYEKAWFQNVHFKPISTVCNVCKDIPDYVAKIETVKEDMNIILRSVNVTGKTGEPFIEVKHLAELFMSFKSKFEHCAPMCDLLTRFWWGQQATGLIANHLGLPVKGKECDQVTGKQLADLAWEAHQKTVGRIDKREQKRNASIELWRQVSMKDRYKVRDILAQDCALFGYDPSPDFVFNEIDT